MNECHGKFSFSEKCVVFQLSADPIEVNSGVVVVREREKNAYSKRSWLRHRLILSLKNSTPWSAYICVKTGKRNLLTGKRNAHDFFL